MVAVAELCYKARGFTFAHDMNAGRRSPQAGARLKLQGMRAGEPDMRFYLPNGKLVLAEYKTARGRLSSKQEDRINQLRYYGFVVAVIKAATPNDAVEQTRTLLRKHGVEI